MKPGQRHSGSFRKGYDPNRFQQKQYENGLTFRQLCQEKSPEALQLLTDILHDTTEDKKLRMAAAIHILDRAHGKPISGVALLGQDGPSNPQSLTNDELDDLIFRHLQEIDAASGAAGDDDALEADYIEVPSE